MDEQCLVLSGEWVCGDAGKWDFIIEKNRMGRMVPVYEGIGSEELKRNVLREFGVDGGRFSVSLSYWPPTSMELATGIRTPPVLITSDGTVKYFIKHFKVKGGMNLFAQFEEKPRNVDMDHVDGSGMGYVSPVAEKIWSGSSKRGNVSARMGLVSPVTDVLDDTGMGFVSPIPEKISTASSRRGQFSSAASKGYVSSAASKAKVVNLTDDDEFVRGFENIGEKLKSVETLRGESSDDVSGFSTGTEQGEDVVLDEIDLRPRGYDKEFWEPLLVGEHGGSNAVNVVFNEDEIVDGLKKKTGPRTYVEVGGCSGGDKKEIPLKPEDYNPWMGGSRDGRGGVNIDRKPTRKLADVDDEEFDIPPMFDDTEYDVSEIPDMDVDEHDGEIAVGKVFGSKVDCQIALAIYAIKKQFMFKQTRTKIDYFVVECPDERCDWRVMAHEMKGCGYYEIRKAQLDHLCPIEYRQGYKSRATSRVIAAVYKAKFGNPGKSPVARDLQKLLLEDLRVNASYMTCYRAKEKAILGVRGSDEDAYQKLPEYLHMLKLANPGTIADLETDLDDDGDERFLYLFLAFGASISGFRKLRHVLVIDGTHLSGKYKGVLLTASGQDGNFQIFPLAFAVVDAEDEDAWTWFLQKVERILSDSPSLAIISDRAVCIENAVQKIYPQAKHGACIVHLARNVNSRYSSKHLAEMVTKTAMAHMPREYKELYAKVRATNSACGVYLAKIGTGRWSRCNFPGERYNIMTSNIAEQLNNALLEGRGANILELVKFIQRMMTRWFSARRRKAEKHRGAVTVEVDKEMTKNMATVKGSYVNSVDVWTCQILGKFGRSDKVMLAERRCSCKYFDNIKIPCGHAILAANGLGVSTDTLCGHWYKTSVWRETYAGVINPDEDPRDVDMPEEVKEKVVYPPMTKRQPGRRRKTRYPSTGEIKAPKKKVNQNKCGRCRGVGHNRTNCVGPI